MAPQQPQGAPRWDGRTQRWVSDGQAPPQTPPQVPQSPSPQPQAPDPGQAPPPAPPGHGPVLPQPSYGPPSPPPSGPVYDPYAHPGPPVPPEPPRPDGWRGRWLTPTTALVAVAALAIGATAVWFVQRDTGEPVLVGPTASSAPPSGGGPGTPSPTATGSPSPGVSPSATPGPSAGAAHETVRDAKGFTIAVPVGWSREEGTAGVFYRSPDRASLIQVFTVVEPELTPLGAVQGASADLRARTTGFQEIRLGPVQDAPGAAELVYEYDSVESHGRRRGVERVFIAQDGKKWAVLTAGPVAEWTLTQAHHSAALAAFGPGG
nr:hypothetical protein OG409_15305 [Streptomyces sp. NBC_00974]